MLRIFNKQKYLITLPHTALLIIAPLLAACGGAATAPTKEQPAPPPAAKEEPKVEEPVTPTGGPTATPHPLEGREDCLLCYETGVGEATKIPTDHSGRTTNICTTYHKPAEW